MSFILDALRKAERERNLGRTPSLKDLTQGAQRAPAARRSWRPLVPFALLLGLLALTYLLWPGRQPQNGTETLAASAPVAPPDALSMPPPLLPATEGSPEPALEDSVQAESLSDLVGAEVAPPRPAAPVSAAPAAPAPVAEAPPPSEPAEPAETAQPVGTATAAEPGPQLAAPSAEAVGITPLRDMPDAYRSAFPALRVDVHVYDADPARRWALIDGAKYLEGSTLPQGPRLESITVDGIVFAFHGQTVLLPIRR